LRLAKNANCGREIIEFSAGLLRGNVFCNAAVAREEEHKGKATTRTTAISRLGDGGGREADFSALPFANARTASVEMTVLWLRGKKQTPVKEGHNGLTQKTQTTAKTR
jgi:hypothetical protein